MTAVLGIDPGQSGGIAFLHAGHPAEVWKMPDTERDICDLIGRLGNTPDDDRPICYIEYVAAMPGQGVHSVFKFGMGYGGLRMALIATRVTFTTVTPPKWQTAMQCRSHGDKNITKRRAQELFPSLTITHALADALLIASYGYQEATNRPWPNG